MLATPVYVPLPGEMQNLINRPVSLDPTIRWQNGRTRVKFRPDVNINKIALVSTSGWWEMSNFGTMLRFAKEFAKDVNIEFSGSILRPHANYLDENKEKAEKIFNAARKAGYQLVKEGKMRKNLLKIIGQPLISREKYWHTSSS